MKPSGHCGTQRRLCVSRNSTKLHKTARNCTNLHETARNCTKLHETARNCKHTGKTRDAAANPALDADEALAMFRAFLALGGEALSPVRHRGLVEQETALSRWSYLLPERVALVANRLGHPHTRDDFFENGKSEKWEHEVICLQTVDKYSTCADNKKYSRQSQNIQHNRETRIR
jgi:hypothetical protein